MLTYAESRSTNSWVLACCEHFDFAFLLNAFYITLIMS